MNYLIKDSDRVPKKYGRLMCTNTSEEVFLRSKQF